MSTTEASERRAAPARPGEKLRCVVVTPDRAVLDEPADFVAIPMFDGELGVLPQRAPLIGRLGHGELRLKRGETTHRVFVDGGFAQVRDDIVTVLTSHAVRAEQIDLDEARRKLAEIRDRIPTGEALEAHLVAQERARALLRTGERGHGTG